MCGRYYRKSDKQAIAKAFKMRNSLEDIVLPDFDYNIAPSTFQPIIQADADTGERILILMRWGLVPARIADPDSFKIYTTSNARSEGILDKPIWKGPFQQSRCLIPVDGFYEWVQRPLLASAAPY